MLALYIHSLLLLSILHSAAAIGGEKAFFSTELGTPNVTHRQSVCDRFEDFYFNRVDLRNALEGLQLHVVVGNYPGAYFNYDPEKGIDETEPGVIPVILDELGRRGGFTWRDSFGIYTDPGQHNMTWNETLHWTMDTYDLVADWWTNSRERMHDGVVFIEEFVDSSFVVVTRDAVFERSSSEVTISSFFNWLKPYSWEVWVMTLFTILLSGVVFQVLEWYAGERDDRSAWEWWLENAYLSFINATQAYEYQPKSLPSRLFGISMAIWALVMTATYTANLASLLVDRKAPGPQTIEEAVVYQNKICTWEGTPTDFFVRDTYKNAVRIPKKSELELHQGLLNGDCDFILSNLHSWNRNKVIGEYNPTCDLYLLGDGRKVAEVGSGFVVNADSGTLCTGFIRDVLNLLMRDIIEDGFLERAWENEYRRTQTIDCLTYKPGMDFSSPSGNDVDSGTRQLRQGHIQSQSYPGGSEGWRRMLKAGGRSGGGGAVAAMTPGGEDAQKLTLEQMIGTFVCHWFLMIIAIVIAHATAVYDKHAKERTEQAAQAIVEHGKKRTTEATKAIVGTISSHVPHVHMPHVHMPFHYQPDTDTEAPTTSSSKTNSDDDPDPSKNTGNKMVARREVDEDTTKQIAAMRSEMQSELQVLKNQINHLVNISLASDAYMGRSARSQYQSQGDEAGMDDSNVSTASMMRGRIPSSERAAGYRA
ncbi:Glutamate-gated receptor that probably acts as non- selective cation channel (By similarity) [Seminavis robusta]|uniref:Glutamate-gated receptor that probably acts as non- selective cation channel By similarity n=1 Tax=Seminavis robusta TaxID=568900 RepID=A0A9N8EV02_9STRA|nr:Glutamate-gated receptor that probably acts as non- selective cation channel (By similarity) [Seminavis robusta]|eukprot:Sro1647_g288410.1 Glutamate-gated receptor that probably acts as non- selective cation channel (By similarity) (703) ;mRNA; r:17447-19670